MPVVSMILGSISPMIEHMHLPIALSPTTIQTLSSSSNHNRATTTTTSKAFSSARAWPVGANAIRGRFLEFRLLLSDAH